MPVSSIRFLLPGPGLDSGGERTRNTKLLKMPLCKFAKISLSVDFARKGSLMTKALFSPDVTGLWAQSDTTYNIQHNTRPCV